MNSDIKQILQQSPVIPVLVIHNLEDAIPLSQALFDGGLQVLEITLRTPVAVDAIKQIKQALPSAIIGSGTVIDAASMRLSLDAEVDFMVSPGATSELLSAAKNNSVGLLPGANSPSEVMNLLEHGYHAIKFFPAEAAGGVKMLKAISGPLPQAIFCPTGGINLTNAKQYLSLDNVACVGGSWMLEQKLIAQKNWKKITQLALSASQL